MTSDTEAKMAIAEVIYRYCRAVDRMDRELADTVWHPGGTADYGPTFQGTASDLLDVMWASHAKLSGHSHQVTNILIELDRDQAGSEAYVIGTLWDATESGALTHMVAVGRYLDRWAYRDERWAIDHRRFVYDAVFPYPAADLADASTSVFVEPAAGRGQRQTSSRRDRNDPSYDVLYRQ